jgi:hypothetical protein
MELPKQACEELLCVTGGPNPIKSGAVAEASLPGCANFAQRIRSILNEGVGFALVDGLPLEGIDEARLVAMYWILAAHVERPVAQRRDGLMIYHVRDEGKALGAHPDVRPDQTSIFLEFHNDNSYNEAIPDVVALLCIRPARQGGISRLINFRSVHNALQNRPAELARLYEPFWFDRQGEHGVDQPMSLLRPIFWRDDDGRLAARMGPYHIHTAVERHGWLDDLGEAALTALEMEFENSEHRVEFVMAPGQVQFVANRAIGHSRTEFIDFDEISQRRHLVRLWLRRWGTTDYCGHNGAGSTS